MIFEIEEFDFGLYSPEQLARVRPLMENVAAVTRRNLHLLESVLGIKADRPDQASDYERLCLDLHEARMKTEALEHDLATARAWIDLLQEKVAAAEDGDVEDRLYARVGLVPSAHTVVVAAARRALLQLHHPDRWPHDQQAAATANFKTASAAFDRIAKLRDQA